MRTIRPLLFVTPFSPIPRAEGHRKRMGMMFDILKDAGFRIDVLFIPREVQWTAQFDAELFRQLHTLGDNFFFAHGPTPLHPKADVYELDEWWPDNCDELCRWIFANAGYEIVFCNYIFMSKIFALNGRKAINIVDTHDRFAGRKQMLLDHALPLGFFYTDEDSEKRGVARADIAIAIKADEEHYFAERLGAANAVTIPYVETGPSPRARRRIATEGPLRFGFIGSNNIVNQRSIAQFLAFLDGSGYAAEGCFEFWLFGSLCADLKGAMPAFAKRGGEVDDVRTFYEFVDCVVIPQDFGTGLKIKTAEALAFAMPLIAHAHAFEGLGQARHPAQVCADFAAILQAMRAVCANRDSLEEMALASQSVQHALTQTVRAACDGILSGERVSVTWLHVFVDCDAFVGQRAYRHAVETFLAALNDRCMICLVVAGDANADPLWTRFARACNRIVEAFTHIADLNGLAAAVFFRASDAFAPCVRANIRTVIVADAVYMSVGYDRRAYESWASAGHDDAVVVRCRQGVARACGATERVVDFFRRVPWDIAVRDALNAISIVPEIWVLTDGAFDETKILAFVESCFPERRIVLFDPNAAGQGMARIFAQRTAPSLVFSFTDTAEFDFLKAWCAANGLEIRDAVASFVARGDEAAAIPHLTISAFSSRTMWPAQRSRVAHAIGNAGWTELALFLQGAQTTQRIKPQPQIDLLPHQIGIVSSIAADANET